MASLAQVRAALAALASNAVYPNGTSSPSVAGVDIDVRPGWPFPTYAETTFAANNALISIWEPEGQERNVTIFNAEALAAVTPTAQLVMTVSGNTITLSGSILAGEIAVVIVNKVYGTPYDYTVQTSDTLTSIATALAALIPSATALGAVITVPDSYNLIARISTLVTMEKNWKRQKRTFWIINWSPSIAIRDAISNALDLAIAKTNYIPLDILYAGRLIYQTHCSVAYLEKQKCYRDDFHVSVEWETVETTQIHTIQDVSAPVSVVPVIT